MSRSGGERIELVVPVPLSDDRWVLEEKNMPESPLHRAISDLLVLILRAWIARGKRDAMAGGNIALRWSRAKPSVGVDPDVYLVEPAPPLGERTKSLCTWKEGHHAPRLAVEVVSDETADKDYHDGPERYAASGTRELWVFDPLRKGPDVNGGPWVLQVWRRVRGARFERVYQGDGPAFSRELGAWVVVTDEGMRLRVANDAAGRDPWPTAEEAEHSAREAEQKAREAADRARAAAEAENARLRAELARLKAKRAPRRPG